MRKIIHVLTVSDVKIIKQTCSRNTLLDIAEEYKSVNLSRGILSYRPMSITSY
uniref:Uncharacterized protein n=1 Tax=Arion vulgaris TaxID=1028688 RepID=A0A0B6YA47_9EUPU